MNAHIEQDDEDESEDDEYLEHQDRCSEDEESGDNHEVYVCFPSGDTSEYGDMEEQIEHDLLCAFVAAGCDMKNPEHAEQLSECFHCELQAFMVAKC